MKKTIVSACLVGISVFTSAQNVVTGNTIKVKTSIKGKANALNELLGSYSLSVDDTVLTYRLTKQDKGVKIITVPDAKSISLQSCDAFPGFALRNAPVLKDGVLQLDFQTTPAVYLFSTYKAERPYRIPAITQARNGNLIAMSDYRFCGGDIGQGHVNIVARISRNNGKTWGEQFPVATGNGIDESDVCGYGDAALVADRESNEVLMMCCSAPNGGLCWNARQRSVMSVSQDGGVTWPTPVDIKDKIMALLPKDRVNYFVGSGKLCQSCKVKVGSHYRVYVPLWTTSGGDINNYVVYTDDFGKTWNLLGTVDVCPGPGGNEPKCEELPNGDVLLSSRAPWRRILNIYHYKDVKSASGAWDEAADGIKNLDAPGTDGEILILKTRKKSDKSVQYIALQSAPNGNRRAKVSIWYKLLGDGSSSKGVWDNPAHFGADWTLAKEMTKYNSAYSTMCLQADKRIGFYYENMQSGADSDMVYEPLTLSDLGLGEYVIE